MKDDSLRRYAVYIPSSYTGDTPYPAVYNLPGNANFIEFFRLFIRMQETAEAEGFLYVVPEATVVVNPPFGVAPSWNLAGDPNRPDDFAYLEEVLLRVASEFAVDTRRVYTCGHSQGAIMNFLMACRMPEHFAAFGPVSGRLPLFLLEACIAEGTDTRPIATISGTADPVLPYEETSLPGIGPVPSVPDHLAAFAAQNGCSETTTETNLPDLDPQDGSTVTLIQYQDCDEGKDVWLYRVNDGGHYWPNATDLADLGLPDVDFGSNNKDIDGGEALWAFFQQYELDPPPFELLNAQRNGRMGPLQNEQMLDQSILPLKSSVQVNMDGIRDSLILELAGPIEHRQVEKNPPYTLFGNRGDRINGRFLPPGDYTLTAIPYVGPAIQDPMVVQFTVEGPLPALSGFTLIDADTDADLGPLMDGDMVPGSASVNFRAMPAGDAVGSVVMHLEGPASYRQRENSAPYALFGNDGEDYDGMMLPPGAYTLTATPYSRRNGFGAAGTPLVVNFEVGETELEVRHAPGSERPEGWNAFPNPARETVTVQIPDLEPGESLQLWLTDLAGRQVVALAPLPDGQRQLQLRRSGLGLAQGVYFLHGRSDQRELPSLKIVWEE